MISYKNNISKLFTKMVLGLFFVGLFLHSATVFAQIDTKLKKNIDFSKKDLIVNNPQKTDSLAAQPVDSLQTKKDSLPESSLKDKLYHYAEDYTEVNEKKKFIKLYNKAHVKYQNIDLKAGVIYVDYAKNEVYAGRIRDSLGHLTQRPIFKQGSTETENDSIRFNFDTKKALVWNTYTKEGEFGMNSEVLKKYNDSVIFVKNIKFTTSTDKEHPEYYFLAKKAKIVPGKKIVIGTTQMWIEDVATPFVIPFGFFPLTETRTSGFLMPTFADTRYGYAITNGGFYWAINKYMDLQATGDIYTNGSYGLHLKSRYFKRYRFSGDLTFKLLNRIESEIPTFVKSNEWKVLWTHRRDGKSNPLSNFSANVNFGSSKYYRDSYNYVDILNTKNRLSNEFGSSISYQHRFAELPINYSINLNHSQNVNTGKINLTLPNFNLSVSRLYPFAKNGMKNNAFQRINFTYRLDAQNSITTTDSLFLKKEMWDGIKSGIKQHIPISTNMKLFKYFNLQPQVDYTEVWMFQTIEKKWDATLNNGAGGEVITPKKGFKSFRNISASTGLSTTLYGTYLFGQKHFLQGVRHTINIGLNASYNPIFDQFIKKYYNPIKDEDIKYTIFDNGMYGKPNIVESKSLQMGISNNFEAKIRSKDGKSKKIRFLTANTGYNFLADSLKINKVNLSSTANITKGFTINMGAIYDFYALDESGQNIDEFAWNKGQSIGRIESFHLNTGYNFNNKTFAQKSSKSQKTNNKNKQSYKNALFENNINWSLKVNYHFNYKNKAYHPSSTTPFKEIGTHSVTFNGDIQFSPSWRIRYQSGYDFVNKGFTATQFSFYRDLKSWEMSLTWNPFEPSYWYFKINIKSSVLQGIKYDKRKEPLKEFF